MNWRLRCTQRKVRSRCRLVEAQVLPITLVLMKAALDKSTNARPKRLRFAIFNHVGRVVHHAREVFIRLHRLLLERITRPGMYRLQIAVWPVG